MALSTINITEKQNKSKTFDECVSNKISVIADEDPKVEVDQRTAIAYSHCREKFGTSKARVLFLLEKSQLLEIGLLDEIKLSLEKGMVSADWIEFAALMKIEGKTHAQITDRVNKSPSWIKKYVNPILKEVTPIIALSLSQDTNKLENQEKRI